MIPCVLLAEPQGPTQQHPWYLCAVIPLKIGNIPVLFLLFFAFTLTHLLGSQALDRCAVACGQMCLKLRFLETSRKRLQAKER